MSFTLHLSHIHVCSRDPCMSRNDLCIPVYWCVSHAWLSKQLNISVNSKDRNYLLKDQRYALSAVKIRQVVNVQTYGTCINRLSLDKVARQLAITLCETTNGLTVLLFCDIYIDIGTTLNLLQCLHVSCLMSSHTMQRHASLGCWLILYAKAMWSSYCHNISAQARPQYSLNALRMH